MKKLPPLSGYAKLPIIITRHHNGQIIATNAQKIQVLIAPGAVA